MIIAFLIVQRIVTIEFRIICLSKFSIDSTISTEAKSLKLPLNI